MLTASSHIGSPSADSRQLTLRSPCRPLPFLCGGLRVCSRLCATSTHRRPTPTYWLRLRARTRNQAVCTSLRLLCSVSGRSAPVVQRCPLRLLSNVVLSGCSSRLRLLRFTRRGTIGLLSRPRYMRRTRKRMVSFRIFRGPLLPRASSPRDRRPATNTWAHTLSPPSGRGRLRCSSDSMKPAPASADRLSGRSSPAASAARGAAGALSADRPTQDSFCARTPVGTRN